MQHQVLRGVISSLFRMDDIVRHPAARCAHDIEVCLIDIDGLPGSTACPARKTAARVAGSASVRIWKAVCLCRAQLGLAPACQRRLSGRLRSWLEWITFVVGLAMTGLFGGFLLIVTGYTRRMEGECSSAPPSWPMPTSSCNPAGCHPQGRSQCQLSGLARQPDRPAQPAVLAEHGTRALEEAGQARQLAVLFLDMDEFKTVNDSLGHPVGDQLLVSIARRLQQPLPPEAMLARLGGDEFVILMPYTQQSQLESLASTAGLV
jgi:hypothetical protein